MFTLEDDYLADFEQDQKADPLFAYDLYDQVIYLKSFSKIIFPGLRIGVIVLPDNILSNFLALKRVIDYDTSLITQGALELYLKSGMFTSHSTLLAKRYAKKAMLLHQEFKRQLKDCSISIDYKRPISLDTKLHFTLPQNINLTELIQRLKAENVFMRSINENYLSNFYKENIIKIDVRYTNKSLIPTGIQTIFQILDQMV